MSVGTVLCRRDITTVSRRAAYRTCVNCGCVSMANRFIAARRCYRCLMVLLAFTLRLVVVLSVLQPAIADDVGVRQQYHDDVASRTIQANVVLEGQVDGVLSDRAPVMVVRVLKVFKDHRLRHALSTHSTGLRVAVDYSSLLDRFDVADAAENSDDDVSVSDVMLPTSLTRGARLVVFLRRDADAALTYYITSGGTRRRRSVDLYRASASPEIVTESARKVVEKYSKRRNGEYS